MQRYEQPAIDEGIGSDARFVKESFAENLRAVRRQLAGKQIALSKAIGCTDSAVSLWESGARLPTPRSLSRILAAIAEGGASTADILALRASWRDAYARRSETWGMLRSERIGGARERV